MPTAAPVSGCCTAAASACGPRITLDLRASARSLLSAARWPPPPAALTRENLLDQREQRGHRQAVPERRHRRSSELRADADVARRSSSSLGPDRRRGRRSVSTTTATWSPLTLGRSARTPCPRRCATGASTRRSPARMMLRAPAASPRWPSASPSRRQAPPTSRSCSLQDAADTLAASACRCSSARRSSPPLAGAPLGVVGRRAGRCARSADVGERRRGDRRRPPRHPPRAEPTTRDLRVLAAVVQRHGRRAPGRGSSATPASRPTSATSCARRS